MSPETLIEITTQTHAGLMAAAFKKLLRGEATAGAVVFTRSIPPEVIPVLCGMKDTFIIPHWQVYGVGSELRPEERLITGDRAVELREGKAEPMLLLVDSTQAGAGMDGIYSASREITESQLFEAAAKIAKKQMGRAWKTFAEKAVKAAGDTLHGISVSPWQEFDFLARCCDGSGHSSESDLLSELDAPSPPSLLHLLGLWPIDAGSSDMVPVAMELLPTSKLLVQRLLSRAAAAVPATDKVDALRLDADSEHLKAELTRFLRDVIHMPAERALNELVKRPHLWAGKLRPQLTAEGLKSVELASWFKPNSGDKVLLAWSGLRPSADLDPDNFMPELIFDVDEDSASPGHLEIRWNTTPVKLPKGSITYEITIKTSFNDDAIASDTVSHKEKGPQKVRFTRDHFPELDALRLMPN